MTTHRAVSPEEWTAARIGHVEREMELTRLQDRLGQERRALRPREEYKDRRAAP
jgi:predicted dithiol-disulfide oxidoreductase (DUF899 family)